MLSSTLLVERRVCSFAASSGKSAKLDVGELYIRVWVVVSGRGLFPSIVTI